MSLSPYHLLPCADAAADVADRAPMALTLAAAGPQPFAYIGQGLTIDEFEAYVLAYDFGTVPPDFVVIHHTANPAASWAPAPGVPNWDANEAGKNLEQLRAKRKVQLDGIMRYYRDTLKWQAGPHLFIDDRFVWLFTPMYDVGVHAAEGNSFHDASGKLHYSIGVEVIGNYRAQRWPAVIQAMVGRAVRAVQRRLKTFELVYKPPPPHRPDLHVGSIALHEDFNKPECPGDALTPDFIISVLRGARYQAGSFGAIAQQDRRADAPAAKLYQPGEPFEGDGEQAGYVHDRTGIGFVPLGQVVRL